MPMYSDQPVVSLPYCGYSERFLKSLIKKKPIDDMLPMDIPDPWYNSHMVISAEQTPSWLLKSLPTSSPMYCNNKRNTQSRHQKSSLNRNASTRTTNTTCSARSSSNNRTRNLPALPSTSSPPKSLSRSPPALPSTNNYPTVSSAKTMRRPDTESIIRWIDQRLSLQGHAGKKTRIPIRRSSLFQQPNPQPTQKQPTIQCKPATAPPLLVRRRSSSASSDVNRILSSLASSKGPDMRLHQLTGPDKYDMSEWPHVLSQNILEQDRLVAQHYIWRTAFDGDFSAPIRQYLETKSAIVLDMGCGPGTWTMEMATEFPRSTFIGIDLAKHYPRDIKPRNCHFHAIDFMPGFQPKLPLPDNSVDYIFQRDLNWDMAAHMWKPLVKEYLRVLKPGGWIELREPVSVLLLLCPLLFIPLLTIIPPLGYGNTKQPPTGKRHEQQT